MSKITIYACPNNCGVPLTAECEVNQTWYVNIEGEAIEPKDEAIPDIFDEAKCPRCGAEAKEYDCDPIPVWDKAGRRVCTAYIPDRAYHIAFLSNENGMSVRRLDIVCRHGADCIIDGGSEYRLGGEGFTQHTELEGQESLFTMT